MILRGTSSHCPRTKAVVATMNKNICPECGAVLLASPVCDHLEEACTYPDGTVVDKTKKGGVAKHEAIARELVLRGQ